MFSALHPSIALYALPEHGGQRSHLHHLLSPVQGDASGQAAQQGGGHQDAAVDLHQVLPGAVFNSTFKHLIELESALRRNNKKMKLAALHPKRLHSLLKSPNSL